MVTAAEDRDRRQPKILNRDEASAKRLRRMTTRSGQAGRCYLARRIFCTHFREAAGVRRAQTPQPEVEVGCGGRRPKAAVNGG